MQAVLGQRKCVEALMGEAEMATTLKQAEKRVMIDKANSDIVLCLGDKVLRDVTREATATSMWAKSESLYIGLAMNRTNSNIVCNSTRQLVH